MGILEYSANNSGGSWWINLEGWKALEEAGWVVHWIHNLDDPDHEHTPEEGNEWSRFKMDHTHSYGDDILVRSSWNGDDWLGAAAKSAAIETDNPDEAVRIFEQATGQNADDEGCNCCGPPHSFSYTVDGKTNYFESRPSGYERGWS